MKLMSKRKGKNLFDKSKVVFGSTVSSTNGTFTAGTNNRTDYIKISAGNYTISGRSASVFALYDNNKVFVSGGTSQTFTVANDGYLIFNIVNTDNLSAIQLEQGSVATTYEPYLG